MHSARVGDRVQSRAKLFAGASAAALLISSPALAQQAAQPTVPPTAPPTVPADNPPLQPLPQVALPTSGGDKAVTSNPNTIVVTGSRIRQPEFTSPDPVSRIDPAVAQQQGKVSIADTLQTSPIAAGSTQITSALSSNFVTNGGPGAESIDLRGLGPNRTLVLLNGRRAGPAGTRGGVSTFDLNVLPQSIVKQIDILKTGASSVYGSDAVAGVVNIITKTDFNGLQLDLTGSVPLQQGGEEMGVSLLAGKTFNRGHFMVALDYYKQNELARGDRPYLTCPASYVFKPNSNQRADLIDPRTGKYHCEDFPGPQVWTYDYEYQYLTFPNGQPYPGNLQVPGIPKSQLGGVVLMQFFGNNKTYGLPGLSGCGALSCFNSPSGWLPTGYNGPSQAVQDDYNSYINEATIIPKTQRYTLYADGAYELTDNIEAYGEFLANRRKTYQNGWRQFWTFGWTGDIYNNPSDPYGTYWAKGWSGFNFLSPTAVTNRGSDSKQQVDYWRGVGGLRGDFGGLLKGWSYDAFVQYSHNKGLYSSEQILQDAIDLTYFQTASCVGQVTPFSHKQCVDLPWLDPNFLSGVFTPEQANYLFQWETGKTIYTQLSGEASVTGNLFDLPGGPVGVALGATARRDSIVDTPGDITLAKPNPYYDPTVDPNDPSSNCGAPLYVCSPVHGNSWGNTSSGITAGHEITSEAFGEIQVPLLKDRPFFRDLAFNGAARVTDVKAVQSGTGRTESNNGNWTYKLGANWAVTNWLRFRGTYGTSFRAPALFEEFKANETSFVSARVADPCVNWGFNLSHGNINQTIANNCQAAGIPSNYGGGSISATVVSEGGIGRLKPETSVAKTASVILTPSFPFLSRTKVSLAVDYFDIDVKGEISQLGPRNIVYGCYQSASYPTDPLCSLFTRGGNGTDPYALATVHDQYINIAQEQRRGLDFTGLIQHNMGGLGSLTFIANATYTLKDTFALFANQTESLLGIINDDNGRTGTEHFVGDFNLSWKPHGGWTLFWDTQLFGKWSNNRIYKADHAGSLCHSSNPADPNYDPVTAIRGDFCARVSVPTVLYHSASITKEFPQVGIEATIGMRNIFDKKPPQVTTIGTGGLPSVIGPVIGTSQYDFLGRRIFFRVSKKF